MADRELTLSSGLVEFDSLEELRGYLRRLLSHFESQEDAYSQEIGSLMRAREKATNNGGQSQQLGTQNWKQVGTLYVNGNDWMLGVSEVLLEAMEDQKAKAARVSEIALKFDELKELNIHEGAHFTVYVRNGVPLRLVIEAPRTGDANAQPPSTRSNSDSALGAPHQGV